MFINYDYRFDQLVYRFIHSENCENFDDLSYFLNENKLPILERWVFYLLGKTNSLITEEVLPSSYKADYRLREVFHWRNYYNIRNSDETFYSIQKKLRDEGKSASFDVVFKIFIEEGYDYLEQCKIDDNNRNDNDLRAEEYRDREENDNTYNSTNWKNYNDNLDMDQQSLDFWNQF